MSSSRRRGRPTGPSAKTLVNTAAPAAAAPEIAEAAVAETSAVAIAAAEGTPLEASVQEAEQEADKAADETQDQAGTAEAAEQPAEPAHETAETAAAEDGATAEAPPAEDAAAQEASGREPADVAIEDVAAAQQDEAVEPVAAMAETVAEAALLPALAEPVLAEPVLAEPAGEAATLRTETLTRRVRIGASFVFSPTLVPLTEINAKLFAFARGEGEAALAHFQALARAKSPAEAIRLQVTEMQRAADASLTCFSEIVRSANRLSETARWH